MLFDIYLLEDVVEAHEDYFMFQLDYEYNSKELYENSFDSFVEDLETLYNSDDVALSLKSRVLVDYEVSKDLIETLLFNVEDEDFIVEFYYKFLFWGPLEVVYSNIYCDNDNSLRLVQGFSYRVFIFVQKLYVYFPEMYTFQHLFVGGNVNIYILDPRDIVLTLSRFSRKFFLLYIKDVLYVYSPFSIYLNEFLKGIKYIMRHSIVYFWPFIKNIFKLLLY